LRGFGLCHADDVGEEGRLKRYRGKVEVTRHEGWVGMKHAAIHLRVGGGILDEMVEPWSVVKWYMLRASPFIPKTHFRPIHVADAEV